MTKLSDHFNNESTPNHIFFENILERDIQLPGWTTEHYYLGWRARVPRVKKAGFILRKGKAVEATLDEGSVDKFAVQQVGHFG